MLITRNCFLATCGDAFSCKTWEKKKFCSKSCANTANNLLYPKRKPAVKSCKKCNSEYSKSRSPFCESCRLSFPALSKTISELNAKAKYQINSQLRDVARRVYRESDKPYECLECGYSTHVDICHIRDLSEFGPDELVKDTCHIDNLVALCKNHHWEFDHGIIEVCGVLKEYKPSGATRD